MKSKLSTFFFVVTAIVISATSAFAQGSLGNDSRIWSKVQIDRNAPTGINEAIIAGFLLNPSSTLINLITLKL